MINQAKPPNGGKTTHLFSDTEIFERKSASQEGFESALGKTNAAKMTTALYAAMKMFSEELKKLPKHYINRDFPATVLNSFVQGKMADAFPEFFHFIKNGRFCLRLGGYMLLFKKVDKHIRPSNIPTRNVDLIEQQQSLMQSELEPIVFIGYRVDKSFTALTGIFASYGKKGSDERWCIDLEEFAKTGITLEGQNDEPNSNSPVPDVSVKKDARKATS